MEYQKIRNKIAEGKAIVEKYKDETPKPVLEVCYSMFDINELLVNKLEELDNKISKNSRNSSRPPSTDENKPKKNQSLRGNSKRSSGGQSGHEGNNLKKVSTPDRIENHKLVGKCTCGNDLSKLQQILHQSRQVFDVKILSEVTEHQTFKAVCSCGKCHLSSFPEGVVANTQYGEVVRGIVAYFSKYQLIPYDRLQEVMSHIFNCNLSEGSIDNFGKYAEDSLNKFKEEISEHVDKMKIGNVDETPTKVSGDKGYFHVLSNEAFSFFFYHQKRGMAAVDELGFLARFKGILVHDCFSMYFNYGKDHAVCNGHLLRELTFIEEMYKHSWANKVKTFLLDSNDLVKVYKAEGLTALDSRDVESIKKDFKRLLEEGRIECTPLILQTKNKGKKRGKQPPPLNLLNRLLKLQREILRFLDDFEVPFTNNQAERDLRMIKVHLKISGGFRSDKGAEIFALFRGYIGTVKKHGLNVLEAIKNLYNPHHNETLRLIFHS